MRKFHRDLERPFFDKDGLSDFDNFHTHVEDAISQMKTRLREGYAFDCQASFILLRVLHASSELSLPSAVQPPESRIPDDWKTDADDPWGRKRHEKIQPKNRLKLFVKRAVEIVSD
ncbi:hypothetical protein B0H13DRAFT_2310275 [Mycena leptocephala]|nr:hypothetical protein B0H13DRAFT_2310275 [Mycena leptocephala]